MKLPRDLSGQDPVRHLCRRWSYRRVHQVGSHIILETDEPSHHRIEVPAHKFLRIGTLNAILSSSANHKGVPREEILNGV